MKIRSFLDPVLMVSRDFVRPLLTVIFLGRVKKSGKATVAASDGHRAIMFPVYDAQADREGVIPVEALKTAKLKNHNIRKWEKYRELDLGVKSLASVENAQGRKTTIERVAINHRGEVKYEGKPGEIYRAIEEKVVEARSNKSVRFAINPKYLYELAKAMGVYSKNGGTAITLELPETDEKGNITKAIYITPTTEQIEEVEGLLMPVRIE